MRNEKIEKITGLLACGKAADILAETAYPGRTEEEAEKDAEYIHYLLSAEKTLLEALEHESQERRRTNEFSRNL